MQAKDAASSICAREQERRRLAQLLQTRLEGHLRLLQEQSAVLLLGPGAVRQVVSSLAGMNARAAAELRDLIADLDASEYTDLGLVAAIANLAERLQRRFGYTVNWRQPSVQARQQIEARLSQVEGLGLALYRIFQETLQYAGEQARAGKVDLGLDWAGGAIRLSAADDGQQPVQAQAARLAETAELVEAFSGRMEAATLHGVGTQLRIIFPSGSPKAAGAENETPIEALTRRESDVLEGVVAGLTNKQIAARLRISDRTVQYHLSNLLSKLGAASRTEAAVMALRLGISAKP
jgi:DNA-binding CsgD family transcriptional regulator/signal transduction histidine kinase